MRLLSALVLVTAALVVPGTVAASARHDTAQGTFTMSNPCTGEDVQITTTNHYLVFGHGDLTHGSGTGVGLTSGTGYRYVRRGFETTVQGFSEVIHLISVGSRSDLKLRDDLGDAEDPEISCLSPGRQAASALRNGSEGGRPLD